MRILIVDDAPEICSDHQKLLRTMGHEAIAVQDPRIVLTQARHYLPDVILLDICMPGMDGWQVAEQLRADPATKYLRIVAVTSMASRECERRSAADGFDAHFNKPVRMEQWPAILSGKS
jgi:two-component system CheB/CheR fusion protein